MNIAFVRKSGRDLPQEKADNTQAPDEKCRRKVEMSGFCKVEMSILPYRR
jgi:hypothetical protein